MINKFNIEKAKKGDQKALRLLFKVLSKPMFMLCLRYVKVQEDAEDVLSTGFTKVFKSLSAFEYRGEGSLEVWVKRIMINECLMLLRKLKRQPLIVEPDENQECLEENILEKLSSDELYGLILSLPEGYRTVFNLYEIEGFSHAEIAAQLDISKGTSKSQLSKAKAYLRQIIIKKGWHNAS